MCSTDMFDPWHTTATSGGKTLLKQPSIELCLLNQFTVLMNQVTDKVADLVEFLRTDV